MADVIGRGVRIEIGKTMGAAKAVSAVTTDSPGVATSAAHALTNGSVGVFLNVTGMASLEGQAVRVGSPDTNTFELQGIDTTKAPAFTGGQFSPVTAWSTVARATNYNMGGGEANAQDGSVLLDDLAKQTAGQLAAQTVSIGLLAEDYNSEALDLIEQTALDQEYLVWRITFKTGAQRIFYGSPSIPGESLERGQLGTGSISVMIKGRVLKLPPVTP